MDIRIQCEECGGILTDRFGAPGVRVLFGDYVFQMECIKCEKLIDISVKVSKHPTE